ncbi:MAG: hypothetical protein JW749_04290 [Sedimentisphaerales bacterium]|nr:hypothetical protein [Sedimentisphaerales bacterium]
MHPIPNNQLKQIRAVSPSPDDIIVDARDLEDLAYKSSVLDLDKKILENYRIHREIRLRRKYARRIFVLIVIWLAAMITIVLLQGSNGSDFFGYEICFKLSDNIVLALIGGTTANIFFIFHFVLKYLYPKII